MGEIDWEVDYTRVPDSEIKHDSIFLGWAKEYDKYVGISKREKTRTRIRIYTLIDIKKM